MGKLRLTWKKSAIGFERGQRETLRALGLRKLHQQVEKDDTPSIRGMVSKVRHLLDVEEA